MKASPAVATPAAPLLAAVFLDMMAFAIILPGLPYWAVELGAGGLELGALLSTYSLAKLFGAAIGGRLSDWLGRRPVLLACLAGSGISFVLTGIADSLTTLALARAVAGIFGGTVATAQAAVADITKPEQRARYMGLIGAAIGTGFVIGPALGAGLARYGFMTLAFTGAGLAFANAALAWWLLPALPASQAGGPGGSEWRRLAREMAQPRLRAVLIATFLTLFAFVSMETTLALLAEDRFSLQQRGFGLVLAFVGVIMIVVQGGLLGRLAGRFGEVALAVVGALLLGISMIALPAAATLPAALAVLMVLAIGHGLASPSLAALLSRSAAATVQGGVLGLGQSLSAAGRAIAPLVAGWLYDRAASWPFLVGGLLSLLAAVTIVTRRRANGH